MATAPSEPSLSQPSLSQKVLSIESTFRASGIPHAFGGAIALAYYATPRGTIDIDVNVFLPADRAGEVLDALARLGVEAPSEREATRLRRDGQTRIHWGASPIDLFFSYDPLHDACLTRRRAFPFGESETIHVLSAEDLAVFKVVFDREKDWRDLDELTFSMGDELDHAWIETWLERIVGREDARFDRWNALLARRD